MLLEDNRITNYPSHSAMHRRQFRALKVVTHRRHASAFQPFDAVLLKPSSEAKHVYESLRPDIPNNVPIAYFEHGLIPTQPDSHIPVLLGDRVQTIYVPFRNTDFCDFSTVAPNAAVKSVCLLRTRGSYTAREQEQSRSLHKDPPPNSALVIARRMP